MAEAGFEPRTVQFKGYTLIGYPSMKNYCLFGAGFLETAQHAKAEWTGAGRPAGKGRKTKQAEQGGGAALSVGSEPFMLFRHKMKTSGCFL